VCLHICSGSGSVVVQVQEDEKVEVTVYTHSTAGASFTLYNADTKENYVTDVVVKHGGTEDMSEQSTHLVLNPTSPIEGPIQLKLKATSNAGRFTTNNFFIVYKFSKKKMWM
jgi:hypothetical protein